MMCIVIDACVAAKVFNNPTPQDYRPIIDWLTRRDGKLVFGGRLAKEISNINAARRFVLALEKAGRARKITITDDDVQSISPQCLSDDPHIIALARISGARILCSNDTDLHKDFTNPDLISNPRGRIYQNSSHVHLLRKYGHTRACRISNRQKQTQKNQ